MEDRPAGLTGRHAWLDGFLLWDVYFVASFVGSAVFVTHLAEPSAPAATTGAALTLSQVAWYLLLGRAAIRTVRTGSASTRYVLVALATFVVACVVSPPASVSLVGLIPLMFWALDPRPAILTTAVMALVPTAVEAVRVGSLTVAVAHQWKLALGLITGSAALGAWISSIIQQSQERSELIEELSATRAELAAAAERAGAQAERTRLAGEIHDAIAQSLNSIVMLSQATSHSLTDPSWDETRRAESVGQVDLIERTARDALGETTALVETLRPPALSRSLVDALDRLATRHRDSTGRPVELVVDGHTGPLPVSTEVTVLRLAQEALSNVARHSGARSAQVRLGLDPSEVSLTVSDDGCGFDPAATRPGFGLSGMQARVAAAGGRLEVSSDPSGTTVHATVPTDPGALHD